MDANDEFTLEPVLDHGDGRGRHRRHQMRDAKMMNRGNFISPMDAFSIGMTQMNYLAIIQTLLCGGMASLISSDVAANGGSSWSFRLGVIALSFSAELAALVIIVCVALKSAANFAFRTQLATSQRTLFLLTIRAPDNEERLVGFSALLTLLGLLGFGTYCVALLPVWGCFFGIAGLCCMVPGLYFQFCTDEATGKLTSRIITLLNQRRARYQANYMKNVKNTYSSFIV